MKNSKENMHFMSGFKGLVNPRSTYSPVSHLMKLQLCDEEKKNLKVKAIFFEKFVVITP